uniref:Small-subunit processome Utp12 domain-containing protein n=1 Tax=Chromera velia CCMP2878 TaxID=1169474 RepID=A0A0G4H9G1_9ALVE|eukprot:Cvel_25303.t1-p1 / transcript=Cvel_25303.t1 / gene=Cvel_25303 / organism=Chromera_velia_CCMP2878 / gene_product=Periodic tryptophan protein 2, putative / transcript_product=Periodic tryptophan protein 2, putative / location=Cvel_scaffold2847:5091-16288(+) / protein_length=1153 / sequence_SO=supercontig / SO=protein_coding / is_pseudo=false
MFSYRFSNLCGASYSGGNVIFSPDGNCLITPVDARINVYDLTNNRAFTLPCENRQNIRRLALSPDGRIILSIDDQGHCLIVNFLKGVILSRINFKTRVHDAKFSPCGRYVAVTSDRRVTVWESPHIDLGWQLAKISTIGGHADKVTSLDWSENSRFLVTTGRDNTVRVFSRELLEDFIPTSFVRFRSEKELGSLRVKVGEDEGDGLKVKLEVDVQGDEDDHEGGAGQEDRQQQAVASRRAASREVEGDFRPRLSPEEKAFEFVGGFWKEMRMGKVDTRGRGRVNRVTFHKNSSLLVVGLTSGVFTVLESPSLSVLHTLSLGSSPLDSLALNRDGEWMAIASAELGQVVVWEWQSESYVLKQQGHHFGVLCCAFSPAGSLGRLGTKAASQDLSASLGGGGSRGGGGSAGGGHVVATGGQDGKVKLWNTQSGFCFVTFADHQGPVNAVTFTPQASGVLSASQDGSVRAYDLLRYRNFRTFAAPHAGVQFTSVAVDGGGEIVIAGGMGSEYAVYAWSIQTGKILEVISGHENLVSSVAFDPHPARPGVVASASWDSTVRVWDLFGRQGKGGAAESLQLPALALSLAWDPRANARLAVSVASGQILFFDTEEGLQLGTVEGLRDILSGRRVGDRFPANNTKGAKKGDRVGTNPNQNQHFTAIAYSPTGAFLIAGSRTSARICVYDTSTLELTMSFQLTKNRNIDGTLVERNSRFVVEGVNMEALDQSDSDAERDALTLRKRKQLQENKSLPGVRQGELSREAFMKTLNVWGTAFSPDARQFAVATSHGLFTFDIDFKGGMYSGTSGPLSLSRQAGGEQAEAFRPRVLTRKVTVPSVLSTLREEQYAQAFVLALALNNNRVTRAVYERVPLSDVPLVVRSISADLLPALLNFLRGQLQPGAAGSVHLQFHLLWLSLAIRFHLPLLQAFPSAQTREERRGDGGVKRGSNSKGEAGRRLFAERFGGDRGEVDMRTLFVMLLRNLQQVEGSVGALMASNAAKLSLLSAQARRRMGGGGMRTERSFLLKSKVPKGEDAIIRIKVEEEGEEEEGGWGEGDESFGDQGDVQVEEDDDEEEEEESKGRSSSSSPGFDPKASWRKLLLQTTEEEEDSEESDPAEEEEEGGGKSVETGVQKQKKAKKTVTVARGTKTSTKKKKTLKT